jgi:hypothetical protein
VSWASLVASFAVPSPVQSFSGSIGCGVLSVPAFFLLLFLSSAAVAAGPQVAVTLAIVVDFVVTSLLAGVVSAWGASGALVFWAMCTVNGAGLLRVWYLRSCTRES